MRRRLLGLHIVLIFGWPGFGQAVSPILPDAQTALGELRKEPFRAHMSLLAHDLLEGRAREGGVMKLRRAGRETLRVMGRPGKHGDRWVPARG